MAAGNADIIDNPQSCKMESCTIAYILRFLLRNLGEGGYPVKKFRHCVKKDGHVHFEIWAYDSQNFSVRLPEFDYIKSWPGIGTDFKRDQLLLFLLAYDRKECLRFILAMLKHSDRPKGMEEKIKSIPIFENIWDEVRKEMA